ncbi:MOSC N-terminal beta barrel domain-containing protein [uncultured Marinobacter sp.]|uniref:MOSC domain-containing protein n=1 Tax=uncultured Marinobacter sp. TaxID=187379 RepID=UPI0030D8C93E
MNIHSLWLYPIKSLPGMAVESFELDKFGPAQDRRWMVVSADGRFVTQRKVPALALVIPRIEAQVLRIAVPGEGDHAVEPGPRWRTVSVWQDQAEALVAQPGPAEALSRFLGMPVELVYMPDAAFRHARAPGLTSLHPVSFADGFPFLVTTTASLNDLNLRLARAVEMRRFRPNIVIEGAEPWAEDGWQQLAIGEARVNLVTPCSRCVMITVDPDTAVRAEDGEPLKTLASFRRTADGVMFGVNAVHQGAGLLRIGDTVRVIHSKEMF